MNLLRSAATRMAEVFYAIHRALCLHKALESTVASALAKWDILSKKPIMVWAAEDVSCDKHWKTTHVLTRAICLLSTLLCFSDSNKPGMEKLYYNLHQTRLFFLKSKDVLEDTTLFPDAAVDGTLDKDVEFPDSELDNKEELEEEEDKPEVYGGQESISINDGNETLTVCQDAQVV